MELGNCPKRDSLQEWCEEGAKGLFDSFGPREQRSPRSLLHHPNPLFAPVQEASCSWGPKELTTFGTFTFKAGAKFLAKFGPKFLAKFLAKFAGLFRAKNQIQRKLQPRVPLVLHSRIGESSGKNFQRRFCRGTPAKPNSHKLSFG